MAKDFFFPQFDIDLYSSSDFRFKFDIDNGTYVTEEAQGDPRSRVVFHMKWYGTGIVFDVWNGTQWFIQRQEYLGPMQRGIVRTDIVVHDNIMTVSDFGVVWKVVYLKARVSTTNATGNCTHRHCCSR